MNFQLHSLTGVLKITSSISVQHKIRFLYYLIQNSKVLRLSILMCKILALHLVILMMPKISISRDFKK